MQSRKKSSNYWTLRRSNISFNKCHPKPGISTNTSSGIRRSSSRLWIRFISIKASSSALGVWSFCLFIVLYFKIPWAETSCVGHRSSATEVQPSTHSTRLTEPTHCVGEQLYRRAVKESLAVFCGSEINFRYMLFEVNLKNLFFHKFR